MLLIALLGLTLALVGLLAGVHLTGQFILNPPLRELPFGPYLTMKRLLDRDAPRLAKPLMLAALASTAVSVVIATVGGELATIAGTSIALTALIVTLVATIRGDLPINRAMAKWDEAAPPSDWKKVRNRWERFFLLRVVTTSIAVCAVLAALIAAAPR